MNRDEELAEKAPDEKLDVILGQIEDAVAVGVPLKSSVKRSIPKIPRDRKILIKKRKQVQTQLSRSVTEAKKE